MSDEEDDTQQPEDEPKMEGKFAAFKRISFNKLVSQIGGENAKFSRRTRIQKDEDGTFFVESLTKWNDQDHSVHYVDFSNEIPSEELQTYAQLLFHSKHIVECLLKRMGDQTTKSVPAFCELLTAIATDLREDFNPYVWDSFDALVEILDVGDRSKDSLEAAFYCLTSLVKLTWKFLVKNIKKSFHRFVPLFQSAREYVRRFAAESLAFVLRKMGNLREITKFIVEQAYKVNDDYLLIGSATLLFHVYKGLSGGFHSSADEQVKEIIAGVLSIEDEAVKEKGVDILKLMIEQTVNFVKRAKKMNVSIVQNALLEVFEKGANVYAVSLSFRLLPLLYEDSDDGILFTAQKPLCNLLKTFVASESFFVNSYFVDFMIQTLNVVLVADSHNVVIKDIFMQMLLNPKENKVDLLLDLLLGIYEIRAFDLFVLPAIGHFATVVFKLNDVQLSEKLLTLYSRICTSRRPVVDLPKTRIPFYDVSQHKSLQEYVLSNLPQLETLQLSHSVRIVNVWPWVFNQHATVTGSDHVLTFLKSLLKSEEVDQVRSQASFIVASALVLVDSTTLQQLDVEQVEEFVRKSGCSDSAIRFYNTVIQACCWENDIKTLIRVSTLLKPAFTCSNAVTRQTALSVLSSIEVPLEGTGARDENGHKLPDPEGVFTILLNAELCETRDTRSRLMQFRKLLYGAHVRQMPKGRVKEFEHIILRIAYSQFFVQFTLLWPGIHEILTSFARGLPIDDFWTVTSEFMTEVQKNCEISDKEDGDQSGFIDLLPNVDGSNRNDFLTARIQLLKFLAKIHDIAERRTRVLSPILLKLYNQDFLRIMKDKEDENEEEANRRKMTAGELNKVLGAFLDLFAKFSDARSVYLEPEIKNMYDSLLTVGNEHLLKSTLACLMSYKHKHISPYRENLERLVDEKTFREELVQFKISEDEEDAVLAAEHRQAVMPLLLRILYGKMLQKVKRNFVNSRRVAVFRFLNGCRPHELTLFLEIVYKPIIDVVGKDEDMVDNMAKFCDSTEQLDRWKMKSLKDALINTGDLLRRAARCLDDSQQTFILRLVLSLGVVIRALIHNKDVPSYRREQAKDVRIEFSDVLSTLVSVFPNRTLTDQEVNELMDVVVNTYIEEQTSKSGEKMAVLPASVVKFLSSLAKYPKYYNVFTHEVKTNIGEPSSTVMSLLINALLWSGTPSTTVQIVRTALLNLLTIADEPEMKKTETDKIKIITGENYGTSIVVAHLSRVLLFLVEALDAFNPETFEIINRLSDFVTDGEMGCRMAQTLFGHLRRHVPKEEVAKKMFYTLSRLVVQVEKPQEFLRHLGPMASHVSGRVGREGMTSVFHGFCENVRLEQEIKDLLKIAIDLDTWDARRVDEPDHDKRHAGYTALLKIFKTVTTMNVDVLVLFIHTNFHTLNNIADLSLRTSSATSFRATIEFLAKSDLEQQKKTSIVDKHLINLTLRTFRNEQEAIREEAVRALIQLIHNFPAHAHLSHLVQLQHKDDNLDFFINLIHIQLHRRQRALWRLVDQIQKKEVNIPFEVLNKYLIPIIHPYLVNVTSKTSALSDESLRLLNVTMASAPWHKYAECLDFWLNSLDKEKEREKPIIRILCAVIDAFHFEVASNKATQEGTENLDPISLQIRAKVTDHVMPRLQKCIDGKQASMGVHRKARTAETKYYYEDDDIQRAPVALATVKLLKKLPQDMLDQHLHGVVLKLCSLMVSRSAQVRDVARKITLQVCECLGTAYLPVVVKELKQLMNKGFQIHVMIYTVHSLVFAMQNSLKAGDLDSCLDEIVDISIQDQFEGASEEKEVGAIKADVSEAKANRTPETLLLLGRFISPSAVGIVLKKFKDVVDNKNSAKAINRAGDLLTKFSHGLKSNQGFPTEMQLILIYQVLTEHVESMEKVGKPEQEDEKKGFRQQSCYILPEPPKRVGAIVKSSIKSRVHVFVEFALQLLSSLVTSKTFDPESKEDIAKVDPFVPIVTRCLALKYDKIISLSLKSVAGFLHLNLPLVQKNLKTITERMFVLLSEYSTLGNVGNKHSVLQLNHVLFKAFTQIVNISSDTFLTKKHVALLLNYVETDVLDSQKQATAFSLIKAFIRKRVQNERMPEVIKRLEELAITSQQAHIRAQCRDVICEYVGNHPNDERPSDHIRFFVAQLEYEFEDGRLSAAEMLHKFFDSLLPEVLDENYLFCLAKLAARLVNDDVVKCRKFIAGTIRKLLKSISESSREDAAAAAQDWLEAESEATRSVGAGVLVQLSYVETTKFVSRLPRILASYEKIVSDSDLFDENSESSIVTLFDGLVQMLTNTGEKAKTVVEIDHFFNLFGHLEPLCKCVDSTAVQKSVAGFVGLALTLVEEKSPIDYVKVAEWMCWQLRDKSLIEEVAQQASKNVVFVSSLVEDDEFDKLMETLSGICKHEIRNQPNECVKRMTCFKVAAAIAVREKEGRRFLVVVDQFFPLFARELNRKSAKHAEELYELANEISNVLKTFLGEEEFGRRLAEYQKTSMAKTEERKRKLKELHVTAPEEAAELKRSKNKKKTNTKKRKLDALKPYRVAKRKHVESSRLQQDED